MVDVGCPLGGRKSKEIICGPKFVRERSRMNGDGDSGSDKGDGADRRGRGKGTHEAGNHNLKNCFQLGGIRAEQGLRDDIPMDERDLEANEVNLKEIHIITNHRSAEEKLLSEGRVS